MREGLQATERRQEQIIAVLRGQLQASTLLDCLSDGPPEPLGPFFSFHKKDYTHQKLRQGLLD